MIGVVINFTVAAVCGYLFHSSNLAESDRNRVLKYENEQLIMSVSDAKAKVADAEKVLADEKRSHSETKQELDAAIQNLKQSNELILNMIKVIKKEEEPTDQPAPEDLQKLKEN